MWGSVGAAGGDWGSVLLLGSQDSQTGVSQQKGKWPSIIESATVNIILATEGRGGVQEAEPADLAFFAFARASVAL